jgi:hypothetical protein
VVARTKQRQLTHDQHWSRPTENPGTPTYASQATVASRPVVYKHHFSQITGGQFDLVQISYEAVNRYPPQSTGSSGCSRAVLIRVSRANASLGVLAATWMAQGHNPLHQFRRRLQSPFLL